MPIRKPKPTSAGRRFVTYADFAEVTKTEPEKTLVEGLKKSGGRNAHGRKTSPHRRGGAHRRARGLRRAHEDRAREDARRGPEEVRRAQRPRAQGLAPPRRRRQAPVPPD